MSDDKQKVECSSCGATYMVSDSLVGKRLRCKSCGHTFTAGVVYDAVEVVPATAATGGDVVLTRPPQRRFTAYCLSILGLLSMLFGGPQLILVYAQAQQDEVGVATGLGFLWGLAWFVGGVVMGGLADAILLLNDQVRLLHHLAGR